MENFFVIIEMGFQEVVGTSTSALSNQQNTGKISFCLEGLEFITIGNG